LEVGPAGGPSSRSSWPGRRENRWPARRQGAHHWWHVPARRRRLSRRRGRDDDGCPGARRIPGRRATL